MFSIASVVAGDVNDTKIAIEDNSQMEINVDNNLETGMDESIKRVKQ